VIVRRLHIGNHPLLRALALHLYALEPPHPPYTCVGDLAGDLEHGPPKGPRNRPHAYRHLTLPQPALVLPPDVKVSALEFYPAGGGLGWHSDYQGSPGWRVYIGRPLDGVAGVFMTVDGNYPDSHGLATAFQVTGRSDTWHALRCDGPRLALGIRFPAGGLTARTLGL
jgi:hypothetical protein